MAFQRVSTDDLTGWFERSGYFVAVILKSKCCRIFLFIIISHANTIRNA